MFEGHGWRHRHGPGHHSPKGALKYIILDLIRDQPRHGYEIIRILEDRTHGFYSPSPGVVYPTLQLLEEMGYVTSTQQDGKRVYSITEEGRKFLADRQDVAEGIKRRMKDHWDFHDSKELHDTVAELRRLGRLFRQRYRHMDAEKMKRIKDIVAHASAEIEAIMGE